MTKSDKSVMQQALDVLENLELDGDYAEGFWAKRNETIDALCKAIAQPEQPGLAERIQREIDHCVMNDTRLVPNLGKMKGDLAVRAAYLEAILETIAQLEQPAPRGTDAQILKEREITTSAIVGAMAYGYQNGEYPPDDSVWLRPFWEMGRRDAEREALIAQPEQPENSGELHFPLMCKAFRTTVSQGLDKRYEMVFAFPDLTALHAADTEWLNFREAAIAQPTQARMLRNLVATMLTKNPIEQPEPVSQPLTHKEIQEIWGIWESQVFPIIDMETVHPPIAQPKQTTPVRQPLTDDEIKKLWDKLMCGQGSGDVKDFVRDIESAHGIAQTKGKQ